MLIRERAEGAVNLAIELDKHVIPNLQDIWVVLVDKVGGIASTDAVVVDLAAGTTRPLVAHLPKVVLHVSRENVVVGHADSLPQLLGLEVGVKASLLVALEIGDIQPIRVESVDLGEQFPRVVNGLLLEVVPKTPVAQHLEEGLHR
jgi:hypothetical protein